MTIHWPFRVGLGFFAGNVGGDVYAVLRAVIVGIAFRTPHVLFEIDLPSFRYAITNIGGETANLLSWEGASPLRI
jgi:hypothetical protein